jgi:hypothetical protein
MSCYTLKCNRCHAIYQLDISWARVVKVVMLKSWNDIKVEER